MCIPPTPMPCYDADVVIGLVSIANGCSYPRDGLALDVARDAAGTARPGPERAVAERPSLY